MTQAQADQLLELAQAWVDAAYAVCLPLADSEDSDEHAKAEAAFKAALTAMIGPFTVAIVAGSDLVLVDYIGEAVSD